MSVAVEHVFNCGCLFQSHVHNCLTAKSVWDVLCLGDWSGKGFIKTSDVNKAAEMEDYNSEMDGDGEAQISEGWDAI